MHIYVLRRVFKYLLKNTKYTIVAILGFSITTVILFVLQWYSDLSNWKVFTTNPALLETRDNIISTAKSFVENPLPISAFGELGYRTERLTKWIKEAESLKSTLKYDEMVLLEKQLENTALSMYPFLTNPLEPLDPQSFTRFRKNIIPGSKGIVITSGKAHFRYTLHLISSIRNVLNSSIPIQVMYAGNDDLPLKYREIIVSMFEDVETLDLLTVFSDLTIKLAEGGWAMKPFAVLASKFEQIICADGDAVFLQKPDIILERHPDYLSRGTLFFRDRLLWKNVFPRRAEWWRKEMGNRTPSDSLQNSKVWSEGYAEECDSGVLALDKSRLPIFMALLHVCWQNTAEVRTVWTYEMTYGDKESWWFGLELCGVPFAFERHYATIIGSVEIRDDNLSVCSFSIAHLDSQEKLLWFNGSLLKNKASNLTHFEVPKGWMVDGEWVKGSWKGDYSCMKGEEIRLVSQNDIDIIEANIAIAKLVDSNVTQLGIDLISDSDMHL